LAKKKNCKRTPSVRNSQKSGASGFFSAIFLQKNCEKICEASEKNGLAGGQLRCWSFGDEQLALKFRMMGAALQAPFRLFVLLRAS
jgi:hypothetical protein